MNANYRDAVVTNVDVRHDEYFGTQANFGVTLYMDGLFDRNQTFHSRTQDVRNHLARPVQRKQYITAIRDQGAVASAGTVDLTDPDTGLPITVTHVDSNSVGNDLGTFEDPFLTLTDADGSTNDIVYLHADSSYDGQLLSLVDGQRLLGEGGGFQYFVDTSEFGTIVLPEGNGGTDKPIILNAPGDAVTLASNTEAANLQITTPEGRGLFGDGAIDALVNAVMVTNPVTSGATFDASDVDVIDSMFTISGRFVPGIEVINGSIVDISGTQIMAETGPGLFVSDTSSTTVTEGSSIEIFDGVGIEGNGDAVILVDDSNILSSFDIGILLSDNATAIVQNGSEITKGGFFGAGVAVSDTSHFELLSGSSITSTATGLDGDRAYGILVEDLATVLIDNSSITTAGSGAAGIYWIPNASGESWITVQNNSTITTTGDANGSTHPASAIFSEAFNVNHDSVLTVTDSTLSTAGIDSEALRLNLNGTWTANITGTTFTSSMSDEILLTPGVSGTMSMTIFDNILDGGSGTVVLDNSAGGTIEISGPMFMSLSDFAASNGIPDMNVTEMGTITYTPSP
ncbi:MAG TPA: right-handed parallel beta-helix repeat-containing protein [Planctomycetaceae bacterium]|nr:right-handed parallel beta-helix repeat-containing protein [Planctomycetaceae bacterium]